jgi:predicted GNAT family acetyltransferase
MPMGIGSAEIVVQDNQDEQRYELLVDGSLLGTLQYRRRPDAVALIHTEVSPSLEGRGLGARLVGGALDDIRARGLQVVPICPFVGAYIQRHPDYADLVVERAKDRM